MLPFIGTSGTNLPSAPLASVQHATVPAAVTHNNVTAQAITASPTASLVYNNSQGNTAAQNQSAPSASAAFLAQVLGQASGTQVSQLSSMFAVNDNRQTLTNPKQLEQFTDIKYMPSLAAKPQPKPQMIAPPADRSALLDMAKALFAQKNPTAVQQMTEISTKQPAVQTRGFVTAEAPKTMTPKRLESSYAQPKEEASSDVAEPRISVTL